MQWSLSVLVLMGQCCFSTCRLPEYHFIGESKTWAEAQTRCREEYTDLVTVYDMTDMRRLCKSAEDPDRAWIGLKREEGENRTWHWSLPGVEFNEARWLDGEPNDMNEKENCAQMRSDKKLRSDLCRGSFKFICYNESSKELYLDDNKKSWREAQSYCRTHHTDLISGVHQLYNISNTNMTQDQEFVWIGLFRDEWSWSDGSNSSFRNWDISTCPDEANTEKCATIVLKEQNPTMESVKCTEQKPFFCYDDKMILIKENKTWVEALDYCREKYQDLVSITDINDQRWVQQRAKNASSPYVWLGLRYTCTLDLWFWVSDAMVCYNNWDSDGVNDDCDMSGAMDRGGQWLRQSENQKFNFICGK